MIFNTNTAQILDGRLKIGKNSIWNQKEIKRRKRKGADIIHDMGDNCPLFYILIAQVYYESKPLDEVIEYARSAFVATTLYRIITDKDMPNRDDGIYAIQDIRDFDQDTPIIMISGDITPANEIRAYEAGASSVYSKARVSLFTDVIPEIERYSEEMKGGSE